MARSTSAEPSANGRSARSFASAIPNRGAGAADEGAFRYQPGVEHAVMVGEPALADDGAIPRYQDAVPPRPGALTGILSWFENSGSFVFPLAFAMIAGLAVRLAILLAHGFPLNDGGLFYVMTRDLQNNGYALPSFTTYNDGSIPFAYPPLGFYIAGLVDAATPLDLLGVFRWVPLVFNVLTIAVVFILARAMLGPGLASSVAVIAYVVFPRSFTWLIVGGGITRSIALFFALVAIYGMYSFYRRRDWRFLALGAVFSGLAALTHPEIGWFTAFSVALLFVMHGLHWKGLAGSVMAVVAVAAITAPWWWTVIARHGLDPLLAAAGTGGHDGYSQELLQFLQFRLTEEPYRDLLAVLSMVGVFVSISRLNFTLPLWLFLIVILEPRSSATYAPVPMAMLIGMTVAYLIVPGIGRMASLRTIPRSVWEPLARGWRERIRQVRERAGMLAPAAAVGLALLFLYGSALVAATRVNRSVASAVSPQDLAVMRWIAVSTPPDSKFAVMTNANWPTDKVAEWFPAIAGRESAATVQGTEWTGEFGKYLVTYHQLRACGSATVRCVEDWASRRKRSFTHIYVSKDCCSTGFVRSLRESDAYVKVYENQDVALFARRESGSRAGP